MLDDVRWIQASIEIYWGLLWPTLHPKQSKASCESLCPPDAVEHWTNGTGSGCCGKSRWAPAGAWAVTLLGGRFGESHPADTRKLFRIWKIEKTLRNLRNLRNPEVRTGSNQCALCPWCICQTHSLHEVVVSSTRLTQISWFRMFGRIPIHNMSPWLQVRIGCAFADGWISLASCKQNDNMPSRSLLNLNQAFDVTGMHKSWSCFPSYNRSFFVPDVLLGASLKFLCSVWSSCIAPYSSSCFMCKSEVWLRERRREIWRCKRVQCRNIGVASIGHDLLRHWELFPCLPRWTSHTPFIIHYIWQVCVVCWVWTMMRRVSQVRLQELLSGLWHVKIKIQIPWCYLNPCVVRVPCHPAHCATLQDPRDLVERVWLPVYKFEAVWKHVCLSMPPQFQLCQVNTANTM